MFKMKGKSFHKWGGAAFATAVAVSFSILSPLSSELVPSIGITVSAEEVETNDNTAASNIPANALKWNGHSYALFDNCASWIEAEEYCESIGGHLATITSSEENAAVYNYLRSCGYKDGYFGFTDSVEEGTWIWANGEKSDYTNWNSGEPNGETSKEDYAMFYWKYQSGTWNDANFSGGELFICEWDFDNDKPTEELSDEKKSEMTDYINQHIRSSAYFGVYLKDNIAHETLSTMNDYENSVSEACHTVISGIDFTVKAVNFDANGITKTISANDYNKILLDMYYDLEVNDEELLKQIYESSLQSTIKDVTDPLIEYIKRAYSDEITLENFKQFAFDEDVAKWLANEPEYENETYFSLMEKNGLEYKSYNKDTSEIETKLKQTPISDVLEPTNDVFSGLTTANDVMDNLKEIICATMIVNMSNEYREMLIEIRNRVQNVEGHGWEKTDLINALDYEIDYREMYASKITFQQGFEIYEALTSTTELEKFGANSLSKKIWEYTGEKYIKDTFAKPDIILAKFSAAQLAAKVGWGISDLAFNLNDKNNLYYKGKCYAILEEILLDILSDTKNEMPDSIISISANSKDITEYYKAAKKYDLAFRMFTYVESNGCKTYSDYEKAFLSSETLKALDDVEKDTWDVVGEVFNNIGNGAELIARLTINHITDPFTTVYDLVTGEEHKSILDKTIADQIDREVQRLYNTLYYSTRAESVSTWICHGDIFSDEMNTNGNSSAHEYVQTLFSNLYAYKDLQFSALRISCPVEVRLYDDQNNYLGTISKTENTIKNTCQVISFINENTDSYYLIYPENYQVKIFGLDDGKMNIWGFDFKNIKASNMVMYIDINIDDEYIAKFDISADGDMLLDNNCKLAGINVNNTYVDKFDSNVKEYYYFLENESTSIPIVTATSENPNASVSISQATSLTGSEAERTAVITVTAEDGVTQKTYRVIFENSTDVHTHSYSETYCYNETDHWHECACGNKIDTASHVSNGGKVTLQPTSTTEGIKTYSCSVCGYVIKTETIPTTSQNTQPNYTDNQSSSDNNTSYVNIIPTYSFERIKLTGKISKNSVTLSWTDISDADKYTVYQLVDGKYKKVKTATENKITLKNLPTGKYKFKVRYTVGGKTSPLSKCNSLNVNIKNRKPYPTATVKNNTVTLKWQSVDNTEKYAVYIISNGKARKLKETQKTSVKYKLKSGKEYRFAVRAYVDGKWTAIKTSDIIKVTAD